MSIPKAPNLTESSRLPQGVDLNPSVETSNSLELSKEIGVEKLDNRVPSAQVARLLGATPNNILSPQNNLQSGQVAGVNTLRSHAGLGASVEKASVTGRLKALDERTIAQLLGDRKIHPFVLQILEEARLFNQRHDLRTTGWGSILESLMRLQNAGTQNHQGLADAIAVVKALQNADAIGLTPEQKAWSVNQENRLVAQQFAHLAPKNFSAKLKEERQVMIALFDSQADVVAAGAESKTANGDAPPVMAASADPQLSASKLADQQLADAEKGRKLQNNSSDEQLAKAKGEATRQQVQQNYAVAAAAKDEEVGKSAGGPLSRSNRGPIV